MKVGIITFHCSYNFGSALQAYALQESIKSLGHSVAIVDYRSNDFDYYHIIDPRHPKNTLKSIANLNKMLRRRKNFHKFWDDYLTMTTEAYSYHNEGALDSLGQEFDCFVCGSDQIWNLDCTKGIVEPFFLSFAGEKRRVAYAPSLGHTQFFERYFDRAKVSSLLGRFDRLSVRERDGLRLYQPLVEKKIEVVVDPTLLLGRAFYEKMASLQVIEPGYIFVYLLRECEELVEYVCGLAVTEGRRIVYVSQSDFGIPNATNLFGIGPAEFVALVAHADGVISNSFHATVFSLLFERDFLTFALDESSSRLTGFMDFLGLGERCLTKDGDAQYGSVDWNRVGDRLASFVGPSWEYLAESLEEW